MMLRRTVSNTDIIKREESSDDEVENLQDIFMPPPMELFAIKKSNQNEQTPNEYMADKYWQEIISVFENTYQKYSNGRKPSERISLLLHGPNLNDSKVRNANKQRRLLLNELYDSEVKYLETLEALLAFRTQINKESGKYNLKLRETLLFAFNHVEEIHDYHKTTILNGFHECVENPSKLGQFLVENKDALKKKYIKFCLKYNLARHVVTQYEDIFAAIQMHLKLDMAINDYLITPIQRLPRYKMLINDILQRTKDAGITDDIAGIEEALDVSMELPLIADSMLKVGGIKNFKFSIDEQGSLLLHGKLNCSDEQQNRTRSYRSSINAKSYHVFVFERVILFTEAQDKNCMETSYNCRYAIYTNNMNEKDVSDGQGEKFEIISTNPKRPLKFICSVDADSDVTFLKWRDVLRKQMKTQHDLIMILSNPIRD